MDIINQINDILNRYKVGFLVVDGIGTVMALPMCPRDCAILLELRCKVTQESICEMLSCEASQHINAMAHGIGNLYNHAIRVITEGYW